MAGGLAALAWPRAAAAAAEPLAAILARSGLGAVTGVAVADAATGAMIEVHSADVALPPASVAKVPTALFALDTLGGGYRFRTRVRGTGAIVGGRVQGDLVLDGGGDPLLDTDGMGELVAAVRARGITSVAGRFLVVDGALPRLSEIEPGQPPQAGYNPAVSGMNLNFNRVHVDWAPTERGPKLGVTAPGTQFNTVVAGITADVGEGRGLRHRNGGGREIWTLPRGALSGRGSIWLPVRRPAAYAGEVFRSLAAGAGLALPAAEVVRHAPAGVGIAGAASPPMTDVMAGMLHYSTNLTAEVAGLAAAGAPATLEASAARMNDWLRRRYGIGRADFVNHSGLTDRSRITPAALVRLLLAENGRLPHLLRERIPKLADGSPALPTGARVLAKTGTMNFAAALAGYVERSDGRRLAFAILAADLGARGLLPDPAADNHPGAISWSNRARAQEAALLRRWALLTG